MAERCFALMKEIECLAGDTLKPFTLTVVENGNTVDISSCTMQLIVSRIDDPTEAILVKECEKTNGKFTVALTSSDTINWNGSYGLHFAMRDAQGLIHRKIAGTLYVYPTARGI